MAAVLGLDDDDADAACRRADGDVWVANFNAPGQVVIAGAPEAVAAAGAVAKTLGAKKVLPLPVGGAFHTPFMAPAREELRKAVGEATLRAPDVPVVANVDARPHTDEEEWGRLLSSQLTSPVRWRQSVQRMVEDGASILVELGPGGVLSGMAKRSAPGVGTRSVASPTDLDQLLETLSDPSAAAPQGHEGEHLHVHERLVVSPAAGLFKPAGRWEQMPDDAGIEVGELIGTVGGVEVRSAFAGTVMGILAIAGERITPSQPVVWLRAS
jgi:[acyl-carrier-protein] S-malonyltransferase